jgi:hypothetical protein
MQLCITDACCQYSRNHSMEYSLLTNCGFDNFPSWSCCKRGSSPFSSFMWSICNQTKCKRQMAAKVHLRDLWFYLTNSFYTFHLWFMSSCKLCDYKVLTTIPVFANQSNLLHGRRRWRVAQLVDKIPIFYETQRFVIVFNDPIMSRMNPVHILVPYFFKTHFNNNILFSMPRSPKLSLPFRIPLKC